jgi:hypothetical protein
VFIFLTAFDLFILILIHIHYLCEELMKFVAARRLPYRQAGGDVGGEVPLKKDSEEVEVAKVEPKTTTTTTTKKKK